VVVSIIFVLEIIAGFLAFVYRAEIERTVKEELMLGLETKYNKPGQNLLTDTWNEMQVKVCTSMIHCASFPANTDANSTHSLFGMGENIKCNKYYAPKKERKIPKSGESLFIQ
jgi:hypothetical protein